MKYYVNMGKIRGAHNSPGIYTRAIDFGNIPSTRNNRKATLSIEERKGGGGGGGHKENVLARGVAESCSSFTVYFGTCEVIKPKSRSMIEPYGVALNGNFRGKSKPENCINIGTTKPMDGNCILKLEMYQTANLDSDGTKTIPIRICFDSVTSTGDGVETELTFHNRSFDEDEKVIEEFEITLSSLDMPSETAERIYIGPADKSGDLRFVSYKITKP